MFIRLATGFKSNRNILSSRNTAYHVNSTTSAIDGIKLPILDVRTRNLHAPAWVQLWKFVFISLVWASSILVRWRWNDCGTSVQTNFQNETVFWLRGRCVYTCRRCLQRCRAMRSFIAVVRCAVHVFSIQGVIVWNAICISICRFPNLE